MNGSTATEREVIRCKHCNLNQYLTGNDCCRRCDKPLHDPEPVEEPENPTPILPIPVHRRVPITRYTPTSYLMNFGPILRQVRQELGFTQEDTAYISGVSRVYLTRIEGGFHDPSPDTLDKMCRSLHITVSDLAFCIGICCSPDDCIRTLQLLSISKFLTMDQMDQVVDKAKRLRFINY